MHLFNEELCLLHGLNERSLEDVAQSLGEQVRVPGLHTVTLRRQCHQGLQSRTAHRWRAVRQERPQPRHHTLLRTATCHCSDWIKNYDQFINVICVNFVLNNILQAHPSSLCG